MRSPLFHFPKTWTSSAAQRSPSQRLQKRRSVQLAATRSSPSFSSSPRTTQRSSEQLAPRSATSPSMVTTTCPACVCTNTPAAENKILIVKLGGLEPLIRQMLSPNVEVQCNAVGCVTNLATHGRSFLPPPRAFRLSPSPQTTTRPRSQSLARLSPSRGSRAQRTCACSVTRRARSST